VNAGGVFLFFSWIRCWEESVPGLFLLLYCPFVSFSERWRFSFPITPALLLEGRLLKDGNGPGSGDKVTHPPEPDFSSLSSPLNSGSSSAKVCWLEQFPVSSPCMAFLFCLWILFALLCEKRVQKPRFWLSFHCFLYPLI